MTSPVYATSEDVRRILGLEYAFDHTTRPTNTQVDSILLEAENEVEDYTRTAWRAVQVTNEYYDIPIGPYNLSTGVYIKLRREQVRDLSTGDKLEVWNGNTYEDWTATKTQGRNADYWIDNEKGVLYLRHYVPFLREKAVRITYKYGYTTIPRSIRNATALIAASIIIMNDDRSGVIDETGSGQNIQYDNRYRNMRGRAMRLLDQYASPMLIY